MFHLQSVCENDAGLNMSKEWIGQSHANVAVVCTCHVGHMTTYATGIYGYI